MAVGDERRQLAEVRGDAHAPKSLAGATDLNSGRRSVVRNDPALREAKEAVHELVRPFARNVEAIFRIRRQRRGGWRDVVPVELHGRAAGPLNDRVAPDRVGERRNQHVGPGGHGRRDRRVEVLHEIADALQAEGIGNWRREGERREQADGVRTSAKLAPLGVGVTVVAAGRAAWPPNVAVKLLMNGSKSAGAR